MRRWETLTALLAVILASASALPVRSHLFFAFAAIALLAVVGVSRLRASLVERGGTGDAFDAAHRARLMREKRNRPRGH
jgi:hypothetical protein